MSTAKTNPANCPGDLAARLSLSIDELATATGISRRSLYHAVGRGDLRICKVGARSVVSIEDAKTWLAGKRPAGVAKGTA